MKELWAPWRSQYILHDSKKETGCVLCRIAKEIESDQPNYVFKRGSHCYSVLNLYPYNNGHSMIVCNRHAGDLSELDCDEKQEMMNFLEITKALLDEVLNPEVYNIGINLGDVAGAGVPGHLHIHIVPRWKGDTNFMPVVSDFKVISQSLDILCKELIDADQRRN